MATGADCNPCGCTPLHPYRSPAPSITVRLVPIRTHMLAAQLVVATTWAVGLGALPNGMWIPGGIAWSGQVCIQGQTSEDLAGDEWMTDMKGMVLKQARLAWQGI
ncbi:unnamed protein product [Clonostachys rhizophaga]|uniref:Uncharacterized protein n=1 Tax=Clonostachys rhizophaga TaxID=160324 RepID=A0A9N9VIY6_9HYPO|nr:unnamed protein product [Clonostachys rhizophaga]